MGQRHIFLFLYATTIDCKWNNWQLTEVLWLYQHYTVIHYIIIIHYIYLSIYLQSCHFILIKDTVNCLHILLTWTKFRLEFVFVCVWDCRWDKICICRSPREMGEGWKNTVIMKTFSTCASFSTFYLLSSSFLSVSLRFYLTMYLYLSSTPPAIK